MFRIPAAWLLAAALLAWPAGAGAQSEQPDPESLADVRASLESLHELLAQLAAELRPGQGQESGSGGETPQLPQNALLRLDAIEAELRSNIGKVERIEARILGVVDTGTVQLRDLELRLLALEGRDIGEFDQDLALGADGANSPAPGDSAASGASTPEQTASRMFDEAESAFLAGGFADAAGKFGRYTEEFPSGERFVEAHFLRGAALSRLDMRTEAARSYLEAYNSASDEALRNRAALHLAGSLARIGDRPAGCEIFALLAGKLPVSGEGDREEADFLYAECY